MEMRVYINWPLHQTNIPTGRVTVGQEPHVGQLHSGGGHVDIGQSTGVGHIGQLSGQLVVGHDGHPTGPG